MKRLLNILWLRFNIRSLKNERAKTLFNISKENPKRASRVGNLEDLRPRYFKEIDMEIDSKERLVKIMSNNSIKKCSSL